MFTGLGISLIRDVPFSGVFYPIYNMSKSFFKYFLVENNPNSNSKAYNLALVTTCASTFANIISCTITHPIDLIRTRVLFRFYSKNEDEHYKSLYDAMVKIYRTNGFLGFFRGLMPRIMRKGFGTIVAWGIYEYMVDKKDAMIAS